MTPELKKETDRKLQNYHQLNQSAKKGQILFAGSSLMEMFPMEQMIGNYDKILSEIEAHLPGVELYLMAYYPVNYEAAAEEMKPCLLIRNNEKINSANREVEKLAGKHHAKYIDINDKLKDKDGNLKAEYTIEGMHIKREGYQAILPDIMKFVEEDRM